MEGYYEKENSKLWDILNRIFGATPAYAHMAVFAGTEDGRSAFLALKEQYLGANNAKIMAKIISAKLDNLSYSGETKTWNFEKYVNAHVECSTILNGLRSSGHEGISEDTRVTKLVDGIQGHSLDAVKMQILASPDTTFDQAVRLYKDVLSRQKVPNRRNGVQVSGVGTTSKDDPEIRYYTQEEYRKLSPSAKRRLRDMRQKKGKGKGSKAAGNNKSKGRGKMAKKKVTFTKTKASDTIYRMDHPMVQAAIAGVQAHQASNLKEDTEDHSEDSDAEGQQGGNRTHPALSAKPNKRKH
jgi:hypothetical protein